MSKAKKININGTVYDLEAEPDTTDLLQKSTLLQSTGNATNNTMSQKAISDELQNKQHTLTAGNNITIENNIISSTGGLQTELDPVFSASASASITSQDISNWNNKQAQLVSGTNIKTVNSQDLLGSGNINIQNGEALPVGSEIDYDGNTVPTGWQEVTGNNLIAYSLYENTAGTSSAFTLSDNPSNYDYIEVFYNIETRKDSTKVWNNGSSDFYIPLYTMWGYNSNQMYMRLNLLYINGTSCSFGSKRYIDVLIDNNGNLVAADNQTLFVTKIVGYKEV